MSANPIENNPTPKTTGSLEELFRHHLGEEAAVPPRAMLWDQIDNSLLIRQNESYRRRLVATRWVAAASLLLATLAGTGWWAGRTGLVSNPEMATTASHPEATGAPLNPAARLGSGPAGNSSSMGSTIATNGPVVSTAPGGAASGLVGQRGGLNNANGTISATFSRSGRQSATSHDAGMLASNAAATTFSDAASQTAATTGATAMQTGSVAVQSTQLPGSTSELATNSTAASGAVAIAATAAGTTLAAGGAGTIAVLAPVTASVSGASLSASVAAAPVAKLGTEELGLLASRSVALGAIQTPVSAVPGALAAGPEPAELALGTQRWQYGASYTASAFNPNINFSREGINPSFAYNPVLGPAELSEQAATEYRQNLHAGFSQRVALSVARHLRGHWSVGTGVELTKSNARSSSTVAFVGEQIADGGQTVGSGQRRTTDFSYTLASLPLELRYSNPAKHGWSLYGRLGGVVSALLNNRSEVAGRPEVTQTYSITSASSPYRRLTSSVRGAAGARFSPGAGRWAFSLGPVAELGLVSLNAHPVQSYFAQSHPYSVGLEAAVEFGR
jgi:hypothetical protein